MEELTSEEQEIISRAWYQFFCVANEFDYENGNPDGWSWFWGIYDLHNDPYSPPVLDVAAIQKQLPEEHWLKKLDDAEIKKICNAIDDEDKDTSEFFYDTSYLLDAFREIKKTFAIEISFSNFVFDKFINFSNFIFLKGTSFTNAKFSMGAAFNNAVFLNEVRFDDAIFCKGAVFDKTVFIQIASFYRTIFSDAAEFTGATFAVIAGFRATEFCGFSEFSSAIFLGHATFAYAKFKKQAPHFYNAKLSADITWEKDAKFWPQLENHEPQNINEALRYNQNAYENLAFLMKGLDKYHDEHFFFRQEMRCRQKIEKTRRIRWAFWLYEWLSDYGYGIERAIVAWFSHIILGAVILFGVHSFDRWNVSLDDFGCSLGISLSNSHAFFFNGGRLKECYKTFESLPWFNVIWGVQTITGTLLIFLVLLTFRVRFRLK